MQLFLDLFTTDYGLVALVVTVISLGLAVGFHGFIHKKMRESESDISQWRDWRFHPLSRSADLTPHES